jgi:hypothetical protein
MDNVEQEIFRLHKFFVEWMTGILIQTDENFALFADSMGENFYIVAPSGQLTPRDTLVEGLYNTYNQRQGFRIWIENVQVRHTFGDVIVATYEEWREFKAENKTTAIMSTVVFTADKSMANGLLWQCVHETKLPQIDNNTD